MRLATSLRANLTVNKLSIVGIIITGVPAAWVAMNQGVRRWVGWWVDMLHTIEVRYMLH